MLVLHGFGLSGGIPDELFDLSGPGVSDREDCEETGDTEDTAESETKG